LATHQLGGNRGTKEPSSRETLPCVAFASSPTTLTHEETPLRTSFTFSGPLLRDIAQYVTATNTTTVQTHVIYDSFGNVIDVSDGFDTLLFGYTARPFDIYTGLQNNLNRWYEPIIAGWLSEDPIGFEAGDANLRRYVENTPCNATDPKGLDIVRLDDGFHQSIELEVWDEDGNYLGYLAVDYAAVNWVTGNIPAFLQDQINATMCSIPNSHRLDCAFLGIPSTGFFAMKLYKNQKLREEEGDWALRKSGTKESDRTTLAYIARSAGKTPEQLIDTLSAPPGGPKKFLARNRWYSYHTLFTNCRTFAGKVFKDYRGSRE
jgi:RHS repeat-associated protein